jgi:phosphate transport system substrate-binding protein
MLRTTVKLAVLVTTAAVMIVACGGGGGKVSLTTNGGTTPMTLVREAAVEYTRINPEATIGVAGGGSKAGIDSLINVAPSTDFCHSGRLPNEDERAIARKNGFEIEHVIIAYDACAWIVSEDNPVRTLTLEQVAGIITGRTKNWSEVGGADMPIEIVSSRVLDAKRKTVEGAVGAKIDTNLVDYWMTIEKATIAFVANNPQTIGFASRGLLVDEGGNREDNGVWAIDLRDDASSPAYSLYNRDHVAQGLYQATRGLYLLFRGEPTPEMIDFARFIVSPEGQSIAMTQGFLPMTGTEAEAHNATVLGG